MTLSFAVINIKNCVLIIIFLTEPLGINDIFHLALIHICQKRSLRTYASCDMFNYK